VASSGEIANASGAERFIGALHRHGVRFMFGQSIPSRFYLATDDFGIKQIAYRTENAGAVMADAYSRVSGRVAVVTGQNAPAATLLVAGLAEALNASIPMVAMVQEVPRSDADRNAFQELDQLELFKGSCKWLKRVEDITRIDDYVDMAFTAAASGRPGPAVLLCPRDMIDLSSVPRSDRALSLGEYLLDRPVAETARIEEAAALLAGAERSLVYAGGGVHLSRATAELADLQKAAHLPVATTTMGKGGVDERHGLSLGVIGYYMGTNGATKFMRPLVDNAGVIVLVGNRTNQNGTDSWTLLPKGARYIHIDIDGQEIGRNYEAMRLQGDAKATLEALTAALARHDLSKRAAARPQVEAVIAEAKAKHITEVAPLATSTAQPIRPERMMADVAKILTPEHIIVADASYASIWVCNNLRSRHRACGFSRRVAWPDSVGAAHGSWRKIGAARGADLLPGRRWWLRPCLVRARNRPASQSQGGGQRPQQQPPRFSETCGGGSIRRPYGRGRYRAHRSRGYRPSLRPIRRADRAAGGLSAGGRSRLWRRSNNGAGRHC
jgi:acetolactate synthase-1/2/3 large subunit